MTPLTRARKKHKLHTKRSVNLVLPSHQGKKLPAFLGLLIWGRRPGRNPPSVLSSIHLIGEPAPPADVTGVYCPFHNAAGTRFILNQPSSNPSPGMSQSSGTSQGVVSAPPHWVSPARQGYASALWVEFPRSPKAP